MATKKKTTKKVVKKSPKTVKKVVKKTPKKVSENELTDKEVEVIREIRDRGFAVVIFNPEELASAEQDRVEDRLVELGWEVIGDLS